MTALAISALLVLAAGYVFRAKLKGWLALLMLKISGAGR